MFSFSYYFLVVLEDYLNSPKHIQRVSTWGRLWKRCIFIWCSNQHSSGCKNDVYDALKNSPLRPPNAPGQAWVSRVTLLTAWTLARLPCFQLSISFTIQTPLGRKDFVLLENVTTHLRLRASNTCTMGKRSESQRYGIILDRQRLSLLNSL